MDVFDVALHGLGSVGAEGLVESAGGGEADQRAFVLSVALNPDHQRFNLARGDPPQLFFRISARYPEVRPGLHYAAGPERGIGFAVFGEAQDGDLVFPLRRPRPDFFSEQGGSRDDQLSRG